MCARSIERVPAVTILPVQAERRAQPARPPFKPSALTLRRHNSRTVDIFIYVYEAKVFFSSKSI